MTVLTTMIGLVPILFSDGTGADVMKRIAAPMVGGLATSFLLELTVYPAIFAIWKRPALRWARARRDSAARAVE
jgi:Cu(I)/Ag(I) efflux system membrane protein CusA/SilA